VRLAFASLLLLVSCTSGPLPTESKIKLGPLQLELPKNFKGDSMDFTYGAGTNQIHLLLSGFTLTNDPMVLSAEAAGYTAMMHEMSGMFDKLLQLAKQGGLAAGGLPVAAQGTFTVPSTVSLPLQWTPSIVQSNQPTLLPVK